MTKITTEHLARNACVYIRQSTADQLAHNHESRRRQYGLVDRAKQLGWGNVEVIDDDLGRSGGGIARPGFERLLATICDGRVGAVLAIEASRLARNGRDWHTLIEFCGLVGTLIVDEDGIYDPRHPNDRLLLGMKGTMSELELSMFRQRSQEALKQKARRGALVLGVAAGYVKIGRDRIEKNPDKRVQDALQLVFTKFAELQSARQVHIWLREERIELPVKSRQGEAHGVVWRLPAYNIVHNILTNPIYAGAYAFGRTTSHVSVKGGRKHVRRGVQKPMAEWDVLIKDHHAAYITWDEFERNLEVIANNATGMSSALARGAARKGELLLPGLLRLRPLRPQAPCALQRQDRPLQLLRCSHEPRRRALHFDQRLEHRCGDQQRGPARPEAARHRGSTQSDRGTIEHDDRGRAPAGAVATAGALRSCARAPTVRRRRPGKPAGRRRAGAPLERGIAGCRKG
jgi:DNA invertase Pin-like site-specific DNA recombinase